MGEYLPIGFIGESKKEGIVDMVSGAVSGAINATTKVISNIGNALTLSDAPEDISIDFKDVYFLNKNINKKEKITIRPETMMIVVHKRIA